mgnify:CR=1 FL=1
MVKTSTCKNPKCNNQVNFKGSWLNGYYNYCCQICAIEEVEEKKAKLIIHHLFLNYLQPIEAEDLCNDKVYKHLFLS